MKLVPVTVKRARAFVAEHHRHLPRLQGGLFAVGVELGGELVGVGLAGHPPRVWMGTGRVVISRVAARADLPGVGDHASPACTMILGALCRAAKALGYREAWTYTLPEEPGSSLRGAGFVDKGLTRDEEHDRPSRARRPVEVRTKKRRWMREL